MVQGKGQAYNVNNVRKSSNGGSLRCSSTSASSKIKRTAARHLISSLKSAKQIMHSIDKSKGTSGDLKDMYTAYKFGEQAMAPSNIAISTSCYSHPLVQSVVDHSPVCGAKSSAFQCYCSEQSPAYGPEDSTFDGEMEYNVMTMQEPEHFPAPPSLIKERDIEPRIPEEQLFDQNYTLYVYGECACFLDGETIKQDVLAGLLCSDCSDCPSLESDDGNDDDVKELVATQTPTALTSYSPQTSMGKHRIPVIERK